MGLKTEEPPMTSLNPFLRRPEEIDVKPGYSFRKAHRNGWSENVTVLDLKTDPAGIPHVRYAVTIERRFSDHVEKALKMLALESFRAVYRERVA
jgi:hypothetical protein